MRAARASVSAAAIIALLAGCAPGSPAPSPEPSRSVPATTAPSATPTTTPDPYLGYFEDRPVDGALLSFYGSFGDVGGVFPVRNEARTLPAGRYDIEVVCIGPPDGVDVVLTSLGDGAEVRAVNVGCSAEGIVGRTDTVEIPAGGLAIELDSGGSTGAFFIAIRDAAT